MKSHLERSQCFWGELSHLPLHLGRGGPHGNSSESFQGLEWKDQASSADVFSLLDLDVDSSCKASIFRQNLMEMRIIVKPTNFPKLEIKLDLLLIKHFILRQL